MSSVFTGREVGWSLAVIFFLVALGNWAIALRWYFRRQSGSVIPMIGGLAGLGACFTLPFPNLRPWWWITAMADPGTRYLLVATAVFLIRRLIKLICRHNLD